MPLLTPPLPPCPNKPNCVSTEESQSDHAIEPYSYDGTTIEIKEKIKVVANEVGKNRLIEEGPDFLRFEFISSLFHFIDDVEFRFDDTAKKVRFRSASRLGYSDMGVNRKRMEAFRIALAK